MNVWLECVVTFFSGALFEAGCVVWVHYSEKNQAGKAAIVSMFNALVTLIGVGESLHDVRVAPAYILGYGVGTYAMVKWKSRGAPSP